MKWSGNFLSGPGSEALPPGSAWQPGLPHFADSEFIIKFEFAGVEGTRELPGLGSIGLCAVSHST